MSEDNYEGLSISLKGHYRMINNEKQRLISEFQTDLDSLNPAIPYNYEPLKELKKKWGERIK